MKYISSKYEWVLYSVAFLLFFLSAAARLDPDFGFQLKMGQIILESGIPAKDPFSYTMSSYPVVSHEWLLVAIIAILFPIIGRIGLAYIFSAFALLSIWIVTKSVEDKFKLTRQISILAFLFSSTILIGFAGIRMQVFSWVLFSILGYLFINFEKVEGYIKYLPLLFLVWANVHGSFLAGLALFAVFMIGYSLDKRKFKPKYFGVLVTSILVTFVNPYFWGNWREVLDTMTDSEIRWRIIEWMPSVLFINFPYAIALTAASIFVFKTRHKLHLGMLFVYTLVLLLSLNSVRHVSIFALLAVPIGSSATVQYFAGVARKSKDKKELLRRLTVSLRVVTVIMIIISIAHLGFFVKSSPDLFEDIKYPSVAVNYLNLDTPESEIFSTYDWGGYLIWKVPEKKVFIDGRMPSWRDNVSVEGELDDAMKDYWDILHGEVDYKPFFKIFNIDTVLFPRIDWKLDRVQSILAYFQEEEVEQFSLVSELKNDGWKLIYEDDVAVVYTR